MSREWIAGKNPVLEALKAERSIQKIWVARHSRRGAMNDILRLAKDRRIVVQDVPKQKLDQLTEGITHQGVVAFVAAYAYADLDDLYTKAADQGEKPFFLILDHLQDPHNIGSILRSADAAGVHGVIIPTRRAAGLTQTVAKTSAGAIHYVPVARVTNLSQTITELKERGLWIFGADAQASEDYRKVDWTLPLALVIGSEGQGVSRVLREKCDFHVRLPSAGHISSLNASVAAALLMFEVYRQRFPIA